MSFRIYVEKRTEFANDARSLCRDARDLLGITGLESARILQRYDVFGASEQTLRAARETIFADPTTDVVLDRVPTGADVSFGVRLLPGQFDQRADSAQACLRLIAPEEEPTVRCAQIYLLDGELSPEEVEKLKRYIINPVDSEEVPVAGAPEATIALPSPAGIPTIEGFTRLSSDELDQLRGDYGLAMDLDDLAFCQKYFASENRNPTLTELRVIDTYWSDHCRHTTFLTRLEDVKVDDPKVADTLERYRRLRDELGVKKPETLMDMATIGGKYLHSRGKLDNLDESDEINACTVRTVADIDGSPEPWLVLFKNETHNHPTEIEPFGGAATCIGGAIRDPLSGRAYVYQAMRVTGAADPRTPLADTIPGKLAQRQIVTGAANGYSSYGNQIGLATGLVNEIYHPGYVAKRMEIGAVVGAAPADNVRREVPESGDVIVLLGGKTGRDGCGGATGSSKTHSLESITQAGAEVQKGNAPEERKLQRLFRNPKATKLIKRCNDFGAGGVSVAIGELAPGLVIDLDRVPKKYIGLDGTELAISESQERMAVVLDVADTDKFLDLAAQENLEATPVATVSDNHRLIMDWQGQTIVDLSRDFLDTNGAPKTTSATIESPETTVATPLIELNLASQRGLLERFDSTVGAGSLFMPLGGRFQETPTQAMAARLPVSEKETHTATVMAYGFDPYVSAADPYKGAYQAVVESLAKLVAAGASMDQVYLSFQEYFERLETSPAKWGKPVAAMLGALQAQLDFEVAAIGGKDSMSGTFENLNVPPTLVSFALAVTDDRHLISPEFKQPGSRVALVSPGVDKNGLPNAADLREMWESVSKAINNGEVLSAWVPGVGGVHDGLVQMSLGNRIGVQLTQSLPEEVPSGSLVLETTASCNLGTEIGTTSADFVIGEESGEALREQLAAPLESTFPTRAEEASAPVPTLSFAEATRQAPTRKTPRPTFLIPVFPGTNCEYDTASAIERAGGAAQIFVVRNQSPADITKSTAKFSKLLAQSQALFIPGGFSGGDEPNGSAKLIAAFLRNPEVSEQLTALLDERGGLVAGICNGFQALVKLGLVPYGRITEPSEDAPTLTHNLIGRHQSRLVRTRVSSTLSPWLADAHVGQVVTVPISHGEGRLVASEQMLGQLAASGQIATQYVDLADQATMDIDYNPAGSMWAIEGLTSPDGRVFGKMGHSERYRRGLYQNVPGDFELGMFTSAVRFLS